MSGWQWCSLCCGQAIGFEAFLLNPDEEGYTGGLLVHTIPQKCKTRAALQRPIMRRRT